MERPASPSAGSPSTAPGRVALVVLQLGPHHAAVRRAGPASRYSPLRSGRVVLVRQVVDVARRPGERACNISEEYGFAWKSVHS